MTQKKKFFFGTADEERQHVRRFRLLDVGRRPVVDVDADADADADVDAEKNAAAELRRESNVNYQIGEKAPHPTTTTRCQCYKEISSRHKIS